MKPLSSELPKYPFVRLLIPLAAGIFCGDLFSLPYLPAALFGVGCLVLLVILHGAQPSLFGVKGVVRAPGRRSLFRYMTQPVAFGVVSFLFFFALGVVMLSVQTHRYRHAWPDGSRGYVGVLQDLPVEKRRSYQLQVTVDGQSVLLYLPKDSSLRHAHRGDTILFHARVKAPENSTSTGTFDYARYLMHRGVTGTAYAGAGHWRCLPGDPADRTLRMKSLLLRDSLLQRYAHLGFKDDELAVLSALTLGEKRGLRDEIKETYSVTGASHILALSGLHTGILWGILVFLLSLLPLGRAAGWVRGLLPVLLLWAFAFLVGLSPSVVRSVTMFSVLALGDSLRRRSLSLNTLALAAWMMLLVHPFYLFDVGFQMSYLAVAAILLIQPALIRLWRPAFRPLRWLWGSVTVSLAAQIGVAPLIALYFSRFSVWFLLTNLIVIPLTFCLVAGALFMLCVGFWLPLQQLVASLLNVALTWMHTALRWIESLPSASVDDLHFSALQICCFYAGLLFLLAFCRWRSASQLAGVLVSVAAFLALGIADCF